MTYHHGKFVPKLILKTSSKHLENCRLKHFAKPFKTMLTFPSDFGLSNTEVIDAEHNYVSL